MIKSIAYQDPFTYFSALDHLHDVVFLDSAQRHEMYGRYSYLAFDPFARLVVDQAGNITFNDALVQGDAFSVLADYMAAYHVSPHPGLPPFQGGAAGFFSYDLGFDVLPKDHCRSDSDAPRMALGFYDVVVSFDHQQKKAWIVSTGLPKSDVGEREKHAQARLESCFAQLIQQPKRGINNHTAIRPDQIHQDFSQAAYQEMIKKILAYIISGDVFEVNVAQRFSCVLPDGLSAFDIYGRLRQMNQAPFAAYVALADVVLASSSPERFLQLHGDQVETRPIKGTIKRAADQASDEVLQQALLSSVKDRAENTMIVDLMRNDLSRVCVPGSVRVTQYCGLETYATVHHLVSAVCGHLQEDKHAIDLLRAAFPGGSITGAPKIRAMEIIDALEPVSRGPYCGSVGYLGFDGCMDTSILIRSYVIQNGQVSFHGGGAIVIDSDPEAEYQETLIKVRALIDVLVAPVATKKGCHDFID